MFSGEREDFRERHAEADATSDFLDGGFGEFFGFGLAEDAGDAAAPLLDEFQLAEDAGDDGVAELGDALLDVLDGEAEKE